MATEGESVALEMLNEARAMAMHTLCSGIAVPARILEIVAQAGTLSERHDPAAVEGAMSRSRSRSTAATSSRQPRNSTGNPCAS